MNRPSWADTWMEIAQVVAKRSKCSRAQVGCVIVARDQTVISTGYSGPPSNYDTMNISTCSGWCARAQKTTRNEVLDPLYLDCPNIHAEQNAIVRADWSRISGASVYVNSAVCYNCAKLLAAAKVSHVFHVVKPNDAHRQPEKVEQFFKECGVKVARIPL